MQLFLSNPKVCTVGRRIDGFEAQCKHLFLTSVLVKNTMTELEATVVGHVKKSSANDAAKSKGSLASHWNVYLGHGAQDNFTISILQLLLRRHLFPRQPKRLQSSKSRQQVGSASS